MSQHDYIVDNASGATVRADLNSALQALASLSSGATAPATTYAYQFWVDTSGTYPALKQRNAANNAWVVITSRMDQAGWGLLSLVATALQTFQGPIAFANTDYLNLPVGTTAQRPGVSSVGMLRYNSDLGIFEGYRTGGWNTLGGGGGGGSLRWVAPANAPMASQDSVGNECYLYGSALGQNLVAAVKVPHGYTAGSPVKLYLPFYSPDNSGTALLQTVSTLIRPGTTAYTSTTNQRTSTNTAVTLGGGTVNIPQQVVFDLTATNGQINSVAVQADDIILVSLQRGTDTATSDLSALVYAAETTFN